jgi:antitoxin ParD1/3/4
MNVSIGERWEAFIAEQLRLGRYASQSEIVREGLRLVEEREARLAGLKQSVAAALEEDVRYEASDVETHLLKVAEEAARNDG